MELSTFNFALLWLPDCLKPVSDFTPEPAGPAKAGASAEMAKSDIVTEQEVTSQLVLSFSRFWRERCNGATVPDREHFTAETLLPWIGHVQIVEVIDHGRDFFHRIVGTEIATVIGRDLSRKYVSESAYKIGAEAMLARYREAKDRREVTFRKGAMIWALNNSWVAFESVTVPVGCGGEQVDQLITVIDYPSLPTSRDRSVRDVSPAPSGLTKTGRKVPVLPE